MQAAWGSQGHVQLQGGSHGRPPRRAPPLPSMSGGFQIHRNALRQHQVICQLSDSFIIVVASRCLLALDQHAVDERVRLEALLKAVGEATATGEVPAAAPASASASAGAISRVAIKPRVLKRFTAEQLALLAVPACRAFLARFHFDYQLLLPAHSAILLRSIPAIAGGQPDPAELLPRLLDDFRGMQQHQRCGNQNADSSGGSGDGSGSTASEGLHLPGALHDILCSRACRSAIMFHTKLDRSRCKALLRQLSQCALPFQCAHGRPSCVPLCRLPDHDEEGEQGGFGFGFGLGVGGGRTQQHSLPIRFRRGSRRVHLRRFAATVRRQCDNDVSQQQQQQQNWG